MFVNICILNTYYIYIFKVFMSAKWMEVMLIMTVKQEHVPTMNVYAPWSITQCVAERMEKILAPRTAIHAWHHVEYIFYIEFSE